MFTDVRVFFFSKVHIINQRPLQHTIKSST